MLGKTLPGLCIALALGLFFCCSGADKRNRISIRDDNVRVQRAYSAAKPTGESIFRLTRATRPEIATPLREIIAADAVFGGETTLAMQPPATAARAMPAPMPPRTRVRFTDGDTPAQRKGTSAPYSYGLTSAKALASLSDPASPALPTAHSPSFAYPTLPPKGINIWGKGMMYKEMKDAADLTENAYTHDGTVYSLGATYDWSVDSTIGLSVDFLQAELTGKYADESRRTDTSGYFINAHYSGAFGGKIPFRAKAMYGWIEQDTSGWADDWLMSARYPWSEEKHDSRIFGFSASVLYPLLAFDSYRVTPEVGFDYRNLRTKGYSADIGDVFPVRLNYPSMIATSHNYYAATTISRDFQQVWGVVTPRLSVGYSMESSDTAGGVRALHASAGSAAHLDMINMTAAAPSFDPGPKTLLTYGIGVDMKVLGGWDISAEYEKKTGREYDRDAFKLEISRCF